MNEIYKTTNESASEQFSNLQNKDSDFFEQNLARRGITISFISNMFEVTFNGNLYLGPLDVVIDISDGGSSWPAEPMGSKDSSSIDPFNR